MSKGYGQCGWCGADAITKVYVEGSPRSKKSKMAPVCPEHERKFLAQGAESLRSAQESRRSGR